MPHYMNGIDRKGRLAAAIVRAANELSNIPFVHEVIEGMDTAELRLIGNFVPPSRRDGAIATWLLPIRNTISDTRIPGEFVAITVRRFADADDSTISGENWKLIDTCPVKRIPTENDADLERIRVGLPLADLKVLRNGGLDCEGIFFPYEEVIQTDDGGQQHRANGFDTIGIDLLEGIDVVGGLNGYLDVWEPKDPEQMDELALADWERGLWLNWETREAAPALACG